MKKLINSVKRYLKYIKFFGLRGFFHAIKDRITRTPVLFKVHRQDCKAPFFIRLLTSDFPTYQQIFEDCDYNFDVTFQPKTIIDAGANIGLASIYFANKFPNAKIISIEPEQSNFDLLKENVKPYTNIIPLQAAVWDKNETINLYDVGLGHWGFVTGEQNISGNLTGTVCHVIQGITVDSLIKTYDLQKIDIFKIDVEGAEKELFNDTTAWIDKVDSIIIELHDGMKEGCSRSFYQNSNGFAHEWPNGENVILTKGLIIH